MVGYRRRLLAVLLVLSSAVAGLQTMSASGQDGQPMPSLALGARGSLNILEDGRFELFSGRELIGPSSHWTVKIGQSYIAPGTDRFHNSMAAPLREGDSSFRMLLWSQGVFTELAYEANQGTAILTATAVNSGVDTVPVAFRCGLDMRVPELGLDSSGAITRETAFSPGRYSQLVGYAGGLTALSCLLPEAPELLELISTPEYAVGSQWDFPFNPSLNLSDATGALVYWPERTLHPGEHYQARVLLSAGPAEGVTFTQSSVSVRDLAISPASDNEQRPRTILVGIGNSGIPSDPEMTILFMLDGVPFSMKLLTVHADWNRTSTVEIPWTPYTAGNYSVSALLPFFDDDAPGDNVLTRPAEVRVNPFRFVMRFAGNLMALRNDSYPGARIMVQMYIYNTGFVPHSVRIRIGGLPERWTALLSSNLVNLDVNQIGRINLTVRTSDNAEQGLYVFNVLGTSVSTGETQTLLMMVAIGPPPIIPPDHLPPIQPTVPGPGNNTPAIPLRPYDENSGQGGWSSSGGRSGMAVLAALAIAAALGIFIVGVYQATGMRTLTVMQKIIRRALYGLATGDEYRKTIFEAYRRMCAHLERYGYTREDHVTPREFERAMRLALPLDTRAIRTLTKLFEEARYSDHAMGERSRRTAIVSLKFVEQELDKLTTFKEATSLWDRLRRRRGNN